MRWGYADLALLAAVGLNIVDVGMTWHYWHLEGNPVVLTLGKQGMVVWKLWAAGAVASVWFGLEGVRSHKISHACVGLLTALYGTVVLSNVAVILS